MDSAKANIKSFNCKHHTSEVIQRVCGEPDCENTLCCIECILSTHGAQHKESMSSLSDFITKVSKHYDSVRRIKAKEDAPPTNLTDFLSKEGENLEALSKHIEHEKIQVENSINELLSSFTLLCHKTKEDLFKQLDLQIANLRANYKYYQSKLDKFYSHNDEDNANPSKDEIVSKLNRSTRLEDFEFIIKNIKDDISESKLGEGSMDSKIIIIKQNLTDMSQALKEQAALRPQVSFTLESQLDALLKEYKEEHCAPFFEQNFSLANAIQEFTMGNIASLDSKIVKNSEQINMIRKWISNGSVKFKLVFRGSRDGFTASKFHEKCNDKVKPSLTIIQSNHNKIFGGFTDTAWTVTNNYVNTTGAFIFSVTDKQKYQLKANMQQYAMYTNASYLACFGGGFDFYLCDNCNTVNSSYSNFGHSYEMNGKAKESLVGAYNFTVKEIEVYSVIVSGDINISGHKKKK